ncbi:ferredoxin reductase domain-containing protein [Komagataeibacter kakiaceti]|uniref:hypothetical protein n=1 Tax=Komagataeibacter kakiaceti TaxID=943261 RepID=UPI000B31679E|nr:hypothetical protein [Komagataeibacter kakiaceti]
MSSLFRVLVDDVAPEGAGCVRLRLVARPGQAALPAFEPGAHVDVMTPSGLIRQYSLCGSADEPMPMNCASGGRRTPVGDRNHCAGRSAGVWNCPYPAPVMLFPCHPRGGTFLWRAGLA